MKMSFDDFFEALTAEIENPRYRSPIPCAYCGGEEVMVYDEDVEAYCCDNCGRVVELDEVHDYLHDESLWDR